MQGQLTANWRANRKSGATTEAHASAGLEVESAAVLLEKIAEEKAHMVKEKKIKKEKPLPAITEEEKPFALPEGWAWCRLDDILAVVGGVTKGKKATHDMVTALYLRVANVQRGYLDLEVMKEIVVSKTDFEKYQLLAEDLLIVEGGDYDKVGRCAIWGNEIKDCIYQNHVFRVRPYQKEGLSAMFMMQYINSPDMRRYFESCSKQTTNLASINKTQLRSAPLAIPPLEEQKAIVEKVDSLMALCDQLEAALAAGEQQLTQLMESCVREVVAATPHG
ncbi:MAG TPA: hypothetical protein DCR93_35105 [Cytophagales bacterium]|nr:hypothetical protein [Cytophagales bacterium]